MILQQKFTQVQWGLLLMATLFLINNCLKETLCCDCMPEAVVIKKVYDKTFLLQQLRVQAATPLEQMIDLSAPIKAPTQCRFSGSITEGEIFKV